MKRLLIYLKDYRKESVLGPAFKLLEVVFELLVPLVMASLIDQGIANNDQSHIIQMFGLLVLFGLLGLAASVTAQYFAAKAAIGFAKKVKHALFSHIQKLSFADLDRLGTDSLITRMTSDINQLQNGVNMTLRLLLRSPFVVFGAMVMAFTIDVKSALIFVVAIPVLSVVVFGIMIWCIPRYAQVQGKVDSVLAATRENLTGVRVLRAFCKEEEEVETFREKNESLTKLQKQVGRVSALMNPVTYILINIAIAVLIWSGAIQVAAGALTQGAVVALYNYMSQILVELIKLANLIVSMTKSIACGNRIQAVFDVEPTMEEGAGIADEKNNETSYMIEFRDVTKKYHAHGEAALDQVSFQAKKGEVIGVIGGTGAGKSSLVQLLPRFYDVTEGEVLVDGRNVKEYAFGDLRRKVSICMQNPVFLHGSIRENLRWGKKIATEEEMKQALEIAQGLDIVQKKEEGLDFVLEQGGKNLSGGQRQRLTLARALLQPADVLILDDSSSALDYLTDSKLRAALAKEKKDTTIFIVSQRTASLQHADKILVLDDGKLAGQGTHEELLERCLVYQEIYYSQYPKEA